MSHLASTFYTLLIYLYPATFRQEFGEEMCAVFVCATNEACRCGWLSLVTVVLRELIDLPRNLLSEHWRAFHRREPRMSNKIGLDSLLDEQFANGRETPPLASWKETILAVVPFILPALFISMPQLLVLVGLTTWESSFLSVLQPVLGASVVLLLLGGLVVAWRSNWPRWTASWYLYFGLMWTIPFIYLANLFEDLSKAADVFSEFVGFFLMPLLIAWLLYLVTRLDPIKGLLAALPLVVLIWQPNMEFVPDQIEIPIFMVSLFFAGLTAVALLRLGNWRIGLWLVILLIALVGLLHSYAGIYHGGSLPYTAPFPSLVEGVKNFIPQFLAVSTLVLGPLLAVSFRCIGRQSGVAGQVSYHLVLSGMLFILAGVFANFFLLWDSRMFDLRRDGYFWLSLMFLFGLLCYLVAVFLLGKAASSQRTLPGWLEYSLLVLLTLFLPVVLMMPVMWAFSLSFDALFTFRLIASLPLAIVAILGFAWLLLAGWLVTHHSPQKASPDAVAIVQ